MRHSYLKRKEGEDAFTDLLFNALLGFAFMFVTAFSLISEPSEGGKITPNAEILITIRWPDDHPDDVDTCLLYTSPSPRDRTRSRMPSSA